MAIEDENNYGLSGAQVKELVEQTKKRAVSVGEDGSSHVEEADQIYTKTLQLQEAGFIFRTTAGNLSVETGSADLLAIKGHTVQEGHVDEIIDLNYTLNSDAIVISLDAATWRAFIENRHWPGGTFTFTMGNNGIWNWRSSTGSAGTATNAEAMPNWGFSFEMNGGSFVEGDLITVQYTKLVIGTLTTATPTSFVATGYNQYDATAGYAHVIGGNQYRIAGTYTSIGIADEPGGTTTTLEVTDGKFTPEADGYVYVSGASGDILIALVWSGTRDSDPYEAFSKTTITIPTIDKESNSLPTATYGMPSVGDVADELNFADRLYIQRIGHYAYSAENLETVEALGVDYWYDEEDIFYVLETPIEYKLADSVRGEYTANDFGTEEFVGTSVSLTAMLTYGNNLVDKLRNLLPIQAIGDKLEMNGSTLNVAQSALSDAGAKVLSAADYNYPTNNPNCVGLWLLPAGVYYVPSGVRATPTSDDSNTTLHDGLHFIVNNSSVGKRILSFDTYAYNVDSVQCEVSVVRNNGRRDWFIKLPNSVADNLTSEGSNSALSAKQGQVLAPKSASGAPTTTTQPYGNMVGKLYIDTDTQDVYIYVGKNGNDYIWKQINVS